MNSETTNIKQSAKKLTQAQHQQYEFTNNIKHITIRNGREYHIISMRDFSLSPCREGRAHTLNNITQALLAVVKIMS